MREWLIEIDRKLLYFINTEGANGLFDVVMPWMRVKQNWIPLYILMAVYLVYIYRYKAWIPLIMCIAAVVLADQISSSIIKPYFARLRPCQNALLDVREVIPCGSGFAFISSHASNHLALALTYGYLATKNFLIRMSLVVWAVLIGYAQIYVGFHYPSDIAGGIILALLVAGMVLMAVNNKFVKVNLVKTN